MISPSHPDGDQALPGDVPRLVRLLAGAGVDVYRVAEQGGNLEELFLQWTAEAEAS